MQNEEGQNVDLYVPRKCSVTNRLITSKDHASFQSNLGHLDANGRFTGQFTTFALCSFGRAQGDGGSALDRLWQKEEGRALSVIGSQWRSWCACDGFHTRMVQFRGFPFRQTLLENMKAFLMNKELVAGLFVPDGTNDQEIELYQSDCVFKVPGSDSKIKAVRKATTRPCPCRSKLTTPPRFHAYTCSGSLELHQQQDLHK